MVSGARKVVVADMYVVTAKLLRANIRGAWVSVVTGQIS
jgi:hypothetical protein